jgi:hypothetical protein
MSAMNFSASLGEAFLRQLWRGFLAPALETLSCASLGEAFAARNSKIAQE